MCALSAGALTHQTVQPAPGEAPPARGPVLTESPERGQRHTQHLPVRHGGIDECGHRQGKHCKLE